MVVAVMVVDGGITGVASHMVMLAVAVEMVMSTHGIGYRCGG